MRLKAPFPYFGGKSRIADVVWQALGDVDHYLEPFFGSGAVLLARDNWEGKTETVCDKNGWVCNLWRALQFDPQGVAKWADWPVNHNDLNARRKVLKDRIDELTLHLDSDPKYYDSELAGYWIWGQSCGIGAWHSRVTQMPEIGAIGKGINAKNNGPIDLQLLKLQTRMRKVRVVCGDWTKICGGNWQDYNWKTVGYFFDPPYGEKANRDKSLYAEDSLSVANDVAKLCLEKGRKENWRIVLAGYYDEHEWLLEHGWCYVKWKTFGGYGRTGSRAMENRLKETLFLSPHCLTNKKQKQCQQLEIAL